MKKLIIYGILILFFFSCKQTTKSTNNRLESAKMDTTFQKNKNGGVLKTETNPKDCHKTEIAVYVNDPNDSITNIRKNPRGEIILKLIKDKSNSEYMLRLTEAKNGWFRIKSPIIGMESDIEIPNEQGWIHGSVISVDTRNYGGEHLKLVDKPDGGKTITIFKNEVSGLRLKDICGNWVKVEYKNYVGWIESKWLCGNPLTNCS